MRNLATILVGAALLLAGDHTQIVTLIIIGGFLLGVGTLRLLLERPDA